MKVEMSDLAKSLWTPWCESTDRRKFLTESDAMHVEDELYEKLFYDKRNDSREWAMYYYLWVNSPATKCAVSA